MQFLARGEHRNRLQLYSHYPNAGAVQESSQLLVEDRLAFLSAQRAQELPYSVFRMFPKNLKMSTSVQPGCKTVCVQALIKYPLETIFTFFRALWYFKHGKEKHYYDRLSVPSQSMLRSFGCDLNRRALGSLCFLESGSCTAKNFRHWGRTIYCKQNKV